MFLIQATKTREKGILFNHKPRPEQVAKLLFIMYSAREINSYKLETTQQIIDSAILEYSSFYPNRVDKRKKSIKKFLSLGYSIDDLLKMRDTHISRKRLKVLGAIKEREVISHLQRKEFLQEVKSCKYARTLDPEEIDGTEDYRVIHRESSNGKGWVIIAPAEPANNWYLEDKIILNILSRKYIRG